MSDQGPTVFSGRYELHRQLARGGMADVFLARDLLLDRPVAVKVLFSSFATDQAFVERFRREAQAAANLSHPNVVNVYDWGEEAGTYFIVMEYVEGRSLAEILATDGALHPDRAAEIAIDVAAALSAAHRNGLVHRDIKPGNVMVSPSGHVKVADFGIATAIAGAQAERTESDLTQAGMVMGTATYFSPEQAQGQAVDPRSDIYSLGVVLYEMLSGRPPFSGDTPVAIAYKHVTEAPQGLAAQGLPVPASLEAITMKAMAKRPANRYPSAEDLRSDLRRYREGEHQLPGAAAAAAAGAAGLAAAASVAASDPTTAVPVVAAGSDATQVLESTSGTGRVPAPTKSNERRRNVAFFAVLIALLVVLGFLVVAFFDSLDLGGGDDGPGSVEVPDVIDLTYNEAAEVLEAAGFVVEDAIFEANEEVDENVVFDQEPESGEFVDEGASVVLTVSASEELKLIPALIGLPRESAEDRLRTLGFDVEVLEQQVDQPVGLVYDQNPPAGETRPTGETVTISVSLGPAPRAVPDVSGQDPSEAITVLTEAGFEDVSTVPEPSDTVPDGKVTRTAPGAGEVIDPTQPVVVYVSTGIPMGAVPNVVGLLADAAISTVSSQGFVANAVFEPLPANDPNVGLVISQSPGGGEQLALGSTVTLVVGSPEAPPDTTPPPSTGTVPQNTTGG